jgi:hypothetical protein
MSTKSSPHKRLKKRLKREIRREQCGRYALESSPLYGLSSIHRLASLLRISVDEFKEVAAHPTYRQTTETDEAGKVRAIQEPLGLTLTLHYRFVRLLDRIKRPAFLHSATRERSHLSNAISHTGMHAMAATDIAKFYENTKTHHLKAFFHVQLGWAHDLAVMMTAALTFEGHLATGSACSPLLSYFTHFKLFERIEALCTQEQVKMSSGATLAYFALYKDFVRAQKKLSSDRGLRDPVTESLLDYEQMLSGWDDEPAEWGNKVLHPRG